MAREIIAAQSDADFRRVFIHLVGTDGITPATGEDGGQPQLSVNGAAFTATGIGTLNAIGFGRYYAVLTEAIVTADIGTVIETRYKSGNTAECPGDTVVIVPDRDGWLESAYTKTLTLGAGTITLRSPVTSTGTLNPMVAGDDYSAATGRSLDWILPAADYGDLTGATARWSAVNTTGPAPITVGPVSGSILNANTSTQTIRVEPTAAEMTVSGNLKYNWQLEIKTAAGKTFTPKRGEVQIYQDLVPPVTA